MNCKNLLIVLLSISISTIYAQSPEAIRVKAHPNTELACNDAQDAGTINDIQPFPSNSGSLIDLNDITYLCYGDSALVIHNNDFVLDGDPNPATQGEVGYAFYSCAPTVIGPELTSVQNDPCLITDPPTEDSVHIARSISPDNANLLLFNDGFLNNEFNNGNPTLFYFAPITFDAYLGRPTYENNGSCVRVSVFESFPVVYLNALTVRSVNTAGLNGSFIIEGGLPEYDGTERYNNITIFKNGNPALTGSVTGNVPGHNDLVNITVPEEGTYTVQVEDNTGCPLTFEMSFSNDAVIFEIGMLEVELGDNFCIPINVTNFDSVTFMSFVFTFNPNIIEYQNFQNWPLTSSGFTVNDNDANRGILRVVWLSEDIINGESLADGSLMLEFCFTTAPGAQVGDMTVLNMGESGATNLEVLAGENSDEREIGIMPGKVTIVANNLTANATSCGSLPGRTDGELTISAFAGTPPYMVNVTGPSNVNGNIPADGGNINFMNLPPGNYNINITDATGSTFNFTKEVYDGGSQAQPRPNFMLDPTPPSCYDEDDGSIMLDTSGGGHIVRPFSIEWSTGEFNTDLIDNLERGTYEVTVTDGFGCEKTEDITLSKSRISLSANVTNASCSGYSDGSAVVDASGGTPINGNEYRYAWDNGSQQSTGETATLSNLRNGWHFVTITDANNCSIVDSFFVSADRKIVFNSLNISEPTCYGENDGSISLTAGTTGGAPNTPYSIAIFNSNNMQVGSPMGPDGAIALNLRSGDYRITIEDNTMPNACMLDTTITLNQPDSISVEVVKTDVTCSGSGMNGTITLNVSGGTPDINGEYDFDWSNGLANSNSHSGLSEGTYFVTVEDEAGCMKNLSIDIDRGTPPEIVRLWSDTPSCPETCDGVFYIQARSTNPGGRITRFEINIFQQGTVTFLDTLVQSNTLSIGGFCGGDFATIRRVYDNLGCVLSSMEIEDFPERDSLQVDSSRIQLNNPSCNGGSDGSIVLGLQGAVKPYIFHWQGRSPDTVNAPTDTLDNLPAGNYSVTVTDINNCGNISLDFTLTDPPILTANFTGASPTSCFNSCDGQITAEAVGGNPMGANYSFEWSSGYSETGVITSTANDLCAGDQWVAIDDGNCIDTFPFTIDAPDSIIIELVDLQEPSCFGDSDGSIEVSASGGNGSYQFEWNNSVSGNINDGIQAGSYIVSVEDALQCVATDTFLLEQPDSLNAYFEPQNIMDPSCPGESDGVLMVTVIGGNGGNGFSWQNTSSTASEANNLDAGTYSVSVEDNNGCSDTAIATLQTAPPISVILPIPDTPACRGGVISYLIEENDISGGNGGPYQYRIGNSNLANAGTSVMTTAGDVILSVIDNNGCSFDTLITLPTQDGIQIDLQEEIELRLGDSTQLTPVITSANIITSYLWTPQNGLSCSNCANPVARPGRNTTYTLTVTDENGCTATATIEVLINTRRDVYIPNTFTPNGDEINDVFRIYTGQGVREIISFQVFDRWGNLMWQARGLFPDRNGSIGWDGTMNGRLMKPGVYTYIAEIAFLDQRVIIYKGDITLTESRF